jgi:hypothetical protein
MTRPKGEVKRLRGAADHARAIYAAQRVARAAAAELQKAGVPKTDDSDADDEAKREEKERKRANKLSLCQRCKTDDRPDLVCLFIIDKYQLI